MKFKIISLSIFLVVLVIFSVVEATDYNDNLVHYIAKQRNKLTSRYTPPTDIQIELMKEAVLFLLNENFAGATRAAQSIGYNLKTITNINNKTYYILESKDTKHRPWGTYVFYLGSDKNNYVIEVPHPEEKNTSIIGIHAFINTRIPIAGVYPLAYLLAGSYKGAGDVTANAKNMFEAVHEVVAFSSNTRVLQIHGFSKKEYPQVVLTSGTPVAISAMDGLVDTLIQNDFEVGIYDGQQYSNCGATQNEQAKFTNSIGGSFIATYLNKEIHTSKKESNKIIDSIKEYTINETIAVETPTVI
jgi:hypothetical protein